MRGVIAFVCVLAMGCVQQLQQQDAQEVANLLDASVVAGLTVAATPRVVPGTVPMPRPFDVTTPCPNGGQVAASGRWDGAVDPTGNGAWFLSVDATLTDCADGDLVFNGAPSVTGTGTFSFTTGTLVSASMSFGGGFRWTSATDTCNVGLALVVASQTSKITTLSGAIDCPGQTFQVLVAN